MNLRSSFRLLILGLFCILCQRKAVAQTVLTGIVSDSAAVQTPLPGSTITIQLPENPAIIAFSTTSKEGKFRLSVQNSVDSLLIKVSQLGYETYQKKIPNRSQDFTILLREQAIALKEVVVIPDPIRKDGDTLSYQVGAFKTAADRTLSDVIKRLPGVSVEPGGRIMYQGKAINTYYIEGLDLLGGRYNLANENLPVGAVTEVQVIENHQPIRILDSLVASESAAINIKLKNALATTGSARIGGGASPMLWDVSATPLLLTRKLQMLVSYQTTNSGNDISRQLQVLTQDEPLHQADQSQKRQFQTPTKIGAVLPIPTPPFSSLRWLRNSAHVASVNLLRKLPGNFELRLNISYLNDWQQKFSQQRTTFLTASETISIEEQNRIRAHTHSAVTEFLVRKNEAQKYFTNRLIIRGRWNSEQGRLQLSNTPIFQQQQQRGWSLENDYANTWRMGRQLFTHQSYTSFLRNPQSLWVEPAHVTGFAVDSSRWRSLVQDVQMITFTSSNSLSFTKKYGQFYTLTPTLDATIQYQTLGSEGFLQDSMRQMNQALPDFFNDIRWFLTKIGGRMMVEYRKNNWRWTATLPLTNYQFSIRFPENQEQSVNRLSLEPALNLSYNFSSNWQMSTSARRSLRFGQTEDLQQGFLLRNYRTLQRRDTPLPVSDLIALTWSTRYRNVLTGLFANALVLEQLSTNNVLLTNELGNSGVIVRTALAYRNVSRFRWLQTQIGKHIAALKTQVSAGYEQNWLMVPQRINEVDQTLYSQAASPFFKASGTLTKWLDLEYTFKTNLIRNSVNTIALERGVQYQNTLRAGIYPVKQLYMGIVTDFYQNKLLAYQNRQHFSDVNIRYTLPNRKIDIAASLNNVFNTKELVYLSANALSYSATIFSLRPRQFLVNVSFPF
ncbi:peptidase associated/transthyretin-like domain-containing protein [Arundinibacter roseus]|uniref:TonB-dependent receptor n=1 Tax=Arundinibacter roseus TaxID=2070510 RepID=A0A4R4KLP4_9BACT|nr:TonB-dependent receptor [Arundinibacter roseus]TDB67541.1 TonB-dependent receptor [Arundinibacter roseus]